MAMVMSEATTNKTWLRISSRCCSHTTHSHNARRANGHCDYHCKREKLLMSFSDGIALDLRKNNMLKPWPKGDPSGHAIHGWYVRFNLTQNKWDMSFHCNTTPMNGFSTLAILLASDLIHSGDCLLIAFNFKRFSHQKRFFPSFCLFEQTKTSCDTSRTQNHANFLECPEDKKNDVNGSDSVVSASSHTNTGYWIHSIVPIKSQLHSSGLRPTDWEAARLRINTLWI